MKANDRPSFRDWVELPENRAARLAAGRVAEAVAAGKAPRALNPLLLHGPSGTGKTHLVTALADEAVRRAPDRVVCLLSAGELLPPADEAGDGLAEARRADLLVVEDLQHLP